MRLLKDRDLLVRRRARAGALRGGRRGPLPGLRPGADRGSPGHPAPEREVDAGRRRRGRQGVLGRRRGRDGGSRARRRRLPRCASSPARSSSADPERLVDRGRGPSTAFWHVLARDVAYGQLRGPRVLAVTSPRREWIESKAPRSASRTSPTCWPTTTRRPSTSPARRGRPEHADLVGRRCSFLTLAGERALGLDHRWRRLRASSGRSALTPPGHPDRP